MLHVNHFWGQKGYHLNFSRKVNSDKDPPMHGCSLQYSSCFSGPSHVFPACAGGGWSHPRVLERLAAPHVAEHAVQGDHRPHLPSTGQSDRLQGMVCLSEPGQFSPPNLGGGLSHLRMRSRLPGPHLTEQKLHMFHEPQFPCTEMIEKNRVSKNRRSKGIALSVPGRLPWHLLSSFFALLQV